MNLNINKWFIATAIAVLAAVLPASEAFAQVTTQVHQQPTRCDASGCTYTYAIVTETVWPDGSKTYTIRFISTFIPFKAYTSLN